MTDNIKELISAAKEASEIYDPQTGEVRHVDMSNADLTWVNDKQTQHFLFWSRNSKAVLDALEEALEKINQLEGRNA